MALFSITLLLLTATTVQSAQSTADVSVTSEQKRIILQKMLGKNMPDSHGLDEYIIGHGDILTVSIFEEGDMSASSSPVYNRNQESTDPPRPAASGATVMMDGRISLREIGDVKVVGLTLTQLADYLKNLYSVIYENPIVTTTLAQSNSLRYTVMGEVNNPGIFFLDYPMDLVQVVARAGGFTEWADRKITVVRQNLKESDKDLFNKNTLVFNYDSFISGKALNKNIMIKSTDIIIID